VEIHKNLRCAKCGQRYDANLVADAIACPHCEHKLPRIDQVRELLEEWYYPRRWKKDIDHPRARFLVERLWQQQFDPQQLFQTLAPASTNYEVFCYAVTDVVIAGIEQGWVRLDLPQNPLADDPVHRLQMTDLDKFTAAMEEAMPDVHWDEDVDVLVPAAAQPDGQATEATQS
jgi:DNA-directed RNA polymerase subunit RPC12/RpoP